MESAICADPATSPEFLQEKTELTPSKTKSSNAFFIILF
jgi:hypothetical protein